MKEKEENMHEPDAMYTSADKTSQRLASFPGVHTDLF